MVSDLIICSAATCWLVCELLSNNGVGLKTGVKMCRLVLFSGCFGLLLFSVDFVNTLCEINQLNPLEERALLMRHNAHLGCFLDVVKWRVLERFSIGGGATSGKTGTIILALFVSSTINQPSDGSGKN